LHISIYSFRILCSSYHSNICSNSAQYQKLFLELTKSTVKACYFYSHIKIQNHTILYHIQSDPIHCHFQRGLFNHLQSASLSDPFIIYLCCHPSFNSACVSLTQNFLMASQLLRIQKKKKKLQGVLWDIVPSYCFNCLFYNSPSFHSSSPTLMASIYLLKCTKQVLAIGDFYCSLQNILSHPRDFLPTCLCL
jgi:hypothetical protein